VVKNLGKLSVKVRGAMTTNLTVDADCEHAEDERQNDDFS